MTRPRIALVWAQFTACHTDRCCALAQRLDGKAEVVAIEVASTSREYADFPNSSATGKARKLTLFPGRSFEEVPFWKRFAAVLRAVSGCRTVCIGVPYSWLEFVALAWLLRLLGKHLVLMSDSKFDDFKRGTAFELLKGLGLSCFSAVMVAGSRGADYFRFLGFRRRPVLFGYDTISIERIRSEAAQGASGKATGFCERDFVFVGRFVAKKNLSLLIEAFARYCQLEPASTRRLVLIGAGLLEASLRREAADKLPAGRVVFAGFLSGPALYARLGEALGLALVSHSEQWGLVINEAIALGVPVIVSESPGARDELVSNGINGFVVETGAIEPLARAMQLLGSSEAVWLEMSRASSDRVWLGDAERFADAADLLLNPNMLSARNRVVAEHMALIAPSQRWLKSPKSTA